LLVEGEEEEELACPGRTGVFLLTPKETKVSA